MGTRRRAGAPKDAPARQTLRPKPLVVLHEGLPQVQDRWGPKPHEDRRLAPARVVQRQRDQDGDERTSDVDSFSAVQRLPPPLCCDSVGVYPVADPANRRDVAAYPTRGPKFREPPTLEVRRTYDLPRRWVNKGVIWTPRDNV